MGLCSFTAWISRFSFFKDKTAKWIKGEGFKQSDIKAVNRILGLCLFVLVIYFISSVAVSVFRLQRMPDLDLEIHEVKEPVVPAGLQKAGFLKAASFYLEKVRQRNIFEIGQKEESVEDTEAVNPPSGETLEITQYLKLVGISWSDDPYAMIEDTRALRTFFLKRGEKIGEIKIQAIFRDKVILNYHGEEIELK